MIIKIAQIIIPVLVIALILFQQRGTALGAGFGGDSGGGFYGTRRGAQQKIFYATIVLVIAFLALSIISLFIQ